MMVSFFMSEGRVQASRDLDTGITAAEQELVEFLLYVEVAGMRQKKYKILKNLLIYLMVIGMIFSFPVTRVFAEGDESGNDQNTEGEPDILSWEEAKMHAVPVTNGMTISFDDVITHECSDGIPRTGVLLYVDVPYNKKAVISSASVINFGVFRDLEAGAVAISGGNSINIEAVNGFSESERFYISIDKYYDEETEVVLYLVEDDAPLFKDVAASAKTLVEGDNTKLDETESVSWYVITGYAYYFTEEQLVKLTIPAGKAVSFDNVVADEGCLSFSLFGDDGNSGDCLHRVVFDNDFTIVDNYKGGRIVNNSDSTVNYYFINDGKIKEITISYHDFIDNVFITIDPNYPDDLNKSEEEKNPSLYHITNEYPGVFLDDFYFSGDGKYRLTGWKDNETDKVYPAYYMFYPEENRDYELIAEYSENPYITVTFDSNYPADWNMQPVQITEKVYSEGIYLSDYSNFDRKEGYSIDKWYYMNGDQKEYCNDDYFIPEGNVTVYAEWAESDEVKVTVHSNYPEDFHLDEVTYVSYILPGETYNGPSYFMSPVGSQIIGWTDQDGVCIEDLYDTIIEKATDFYAVWEVEQLPIEITNQPQNKQSIYGSLASFSVKATGSKLTYNWQYSTDGESWNDVSSSGCKTSLLRVTASKNTNKNKYRCEISDGKTTVYSDIATLSCSPLIKIQPQSTSSLYGNIVSFTIESRSANATYKWQTSSDGNIWIDIDSNSAKTKVLKVTAKSNAYYRCCVKIGNYTEPSNAVKLSVIASITKQPSSQNLYYGDLARFSVTACGSNLQYQWEYCKNGKWAKFTSSNSTGYNTSRLTIRANSTFNNIKIRCTIKSPGINIIRSNSVKLKANKNIINQPKNQNARVGKSIIFHVGAKGTSLKYQWKYSIDGKTWRNCNKNIGCSGYNSSDLIIKVSSKNKKYKYKCLVTNNTSKEYSKTVKVTVE